MSRLLRFHAATLLGRRLRAARTPMLRAIADAGGSQVRVFGSVATEQEGPHSDIDLVFTMGTPWSLMELERLQRRLSDILGADVDLVPDTAVRPDLRDRVRGGDALVTDARRRGTPLRTCSPATTNDSSRAEPRRLRSMVAMTAVQTALARLRSAEADGSLRRLCDELGVDLLTIFGSAVRDPATARDLDVAYSRDRSREPVSHLGVVNALGERFGDALDVMDLDAAGSVARYAGLHGVELLVEGAPGRYANAQIAAFGAFCDTQRFRDRVLEVLAQ